jgi:hypothetical protein
MVHLAGARKGHSPNPEALCAVFVNVG